MPQTGIAKPAEVPWGAHICHFYRSRQDLLDIIIPYLKAGLEAGECCVWVTGDSIPVPDAELALEAAVPDLGRRRRLGQVEIVDSRDWYLAGTIFDSSRVLSAWRRRLSAALARGYSGLRITGDMSWVDDRNWDALVAYETAVNNSIGSLRMIAICSYPMLGSGPYQTSKITRTHPLALLPREQGWDVV
ncbi:MAG: MEDS domain-containing protein [Phycisphaerae bacterium]